MLVQVTCLQINPSCPSCIPPFLKLHCCLPADHPMGLTLTLFGLTDAVPRAQLVVPELPPSARHRTLQVLAVTAPPQ